MLFATPVANLPPVSLTSLISWRSACLELRMATGGRASCHRCWIIILSFSAGGCGSAVRASVCGAAKAAGEGGSCHGCRLIILSFSVGGCGSAVGASVCGAAKAAGEGGSCHGRWGWVQQAEQVTKATVTDEKDYTKVREQLLWIFIYWG